MLQELSVEKEIVVESGKIYLIGVKLLSDLFLMPLETCRSPVRLFLNFDLKSKKSQQTKLHFV